MMVGHDCSKGGLMKKIGRHLAEAVLVMEAAFKWALISTWTPIEYFCDALRLNLFDFWRSKTD